MKKSIVYLGIVCAILAVCSATPCEAEGGDHGWREIEILASYCVHAEDSHNRMEIDERHHEIGVIAEGDELVWVLHCASCPDNTMWKVTDLQLVADLHMLTEFARDLFTMETGADFTMSALKKRLGLFEPSTRMGLAKTQFDLVGLGWDEPAPKDQAIRAIAKPFDPEADTLWKFSVEVWVPSKEGKPSDCEEDVDCDVYDPHIYRHPKNDDG